MTEQHAREIIDAYAFDQQCDHGNVVQTMLHAWESLYRHERKAVKVHVGAKPATT